MALLVRGSVLAVVPESTEGTPVAPSAAGQYMAMQPDFAMVPQIEVLENAEIKGSLAPAKPILGVESPTMTMSHYLKHSGTEGVAPEVDQLLKAAFGTEVLASTEYDTVGSSTVSLIKVDTGEGVNFQRGQALLIKDATNGYKIRPVLSVSSDDLTLGFNVAVAPALGVNLGKADLYKPANSGHQTLSLWHYASNSGAVQMITGARVTELAMNFAAGELINCSYSLEGIGFYFNPVEITASTKYLDFTDTAGTHAAVVATGFYQNPHTFAAAVELAMNDVSSETYTVTYSNTTGKYTIVTATSLVLTLKWNTGANTANSIATKLGFTTAADSSAALTYTSANAISFVAPQTGSLDSSDPLVAKGNELLIGDATDITCIAASTFDVTISDAKTNIKSICATTGISGSLINGREVTIAVTALLNQYDADKFQRMLQGTNAAVAYSFGTKVGGNWVAGKCGLVYAPTCVVQSCQVVDEDGIFRLQMELKAYADASGNGEIYLNFV